MYINLYSNENKIFCKYGILQNIILIKWIYQKIYNIIYILLYQNQFSLIINKNFTLYYILLYFFII